MESVYHGEGQEGPEGQERHEEQEDEYDERWQLAQAKRDNEYASLVRLAELEQAQLRTELAQAKQEQAQLRTELAQAKKEQAMKEQAMKAMQK